MYHPSRGGVRGGRDQFKWDDVKVDKHRENYLGHSVKAPVGRWQKGKDLFWYAKDKNSRSLEQDALKVEIQKVKEEEEQLMREALGLAPKRSYEPQGNRLDKHEFSELIKRGSTAEDLGGGHADAAKVHGLGFSRAPRITDASNSVVTEDAVAETDMAPTAASERMFKQKPGEEGKQKKRKHDELRRDKHEERKHRKHEKRQSHDSDDKKKRRKEKNEKKRRHDSDSE